MKGNFNLDKRQKIIIALILIALVILCWQIYTLFGGSSFSKFPETPKKMPKEISKPISKKISPENLSEKQYFKPIETMPNQAATDAMQQKYLALVNEYQIVEVERMIAQDEASIAQSRAQAAESLAKIGQLSNQSPDMGNTGYNNASVNTGEYELIYTGEDNNQWTATLKKNGQFNDVTAGSVLPDGSKILSVDDNGVLIEENGVKKLVTFNGVTPFQAQPQKQIKSLSAGLKKTPAQPTKMREIS